MKKLQLFSISASLLLFAIIVLPSCKKDPDNSAREQILTAGTWKLTGWVTDYDKNGTYEENSFGILADCEKDNFYTFQAGGTLIKNEGPTMCISTNPQTVTGTWSLKNNYTQLLWGTTPYEIESITSSTLTLTGKSSHNVIFTTNVRMIYTKQ